MPWCRPYGQAEPEGFFSPPQVPIVVSEQAARRTPSLVRACPRASAAVAWSGNPSPSNVACPSDRVSKEAPGVLPFEDVHHAPVQAGEHGSCTRRILVVRTYDNIRPPVAVEVSRPRDETAEVVFDCEPRPSWPRRARCARPNVPVDGATGAQLLLALKRVGGRSHLPIVELKRVA